MDPSCVQTCNIHTSRHAFMLPWKRETASNLGKLLLLSWFVHLYLRTVGIPEPRAKGHIWPHSGLQQPGLPAAGVLCKRACCLCNTAFSDIETEACSLQHMLGRSETVYHSTRTRSNTVYYSFKVPVTLYRQRNLLDVNVLQPKGGHTRGQLCSEMYVPDNVTMWEPSRQCHHHVRHSIDIRNVV